MTGKLTPVLGSMAALMLLASCGSQSSKEPAADTTGPDVTVSSGAEEVPAAEAPAAPAEEAVMPASSDEAPAAEAAKVMVAGFTGDPVAGKKAFAQCAACHSVKEGENRVGPSLYGIIGEKAAEVPNFKFSKAMIASNIVWTPEKLFEYLHKPNAMIPGTTMAFAGIPNDQKRADIVAYVVANGKVG